MTMNPQELAKEALDSMFEPAWALAMNRPIQDFTAVPGELRGKALYCGKFPTLPLVAPGVEFHDAMAEVSDGCAYAFLWGNGHQAANACAVGAALKFGAKLVICEGGWLLSADTWANSKAPDRYRYGCSMVMDARGSYYDATRVSTIEMMLNDPALVVTEEERANARRLMRRIVENRLSKYNHQPMEVPEVGVPGRRKVLVVDQSYGDFAIRKGWASEETFVRMLEAACRENPDADILVKTHPDTMTGTRKGYYDRLEEHGNVYRVTMPVNPYSLMSLVDKVYVCSTQFGFEALMAGKEVHVFGMPFYAGWGITVDDQKNPRRTLRRTLEEVFHIFFLKYTYWVNPDTGRPCSIDESIDWLLKIREEYAAYRKSGAVRPAEKDALSDTELKIAYWKQLKAVEKSKAETWTRLQETERRLADLWERCQAAEKAKAELWQQKQAAETAKAELWTKLQAAEKAKTDLWQQKQAAEKAKAELYGRLQEKEAERRRLADLVRKIGQAVG